MFILDRIQAGAFFSPEHDMPDLSKEEIIAAMKEGAREWLRDIFVEVGKWTFRGISGAILFAIFYFVLSMNGWKKS